MFRLWLGSENQDILSAATKIVHFKGLERLITAMQI
jgi:hypothetical protein